MLKLLLPMRACNQVFFNGELLLCFQVHRQIDMSKAPTAQRTLNTITSVQYSARRKRFHHHGRCLLGFLLDIVWPSQWSKAMTYITFYYVVYMPIPHYTPRRREMSSTQMTVLFFYQKAA